jgi:hypothetical protein
LAEKTGSAGKGRKEAKELKVGKRDSIIIPADFQEPGIGEEDRSAIRKSKSGVALKKVEAE